MGNANRVIYEGKSAEYEELSKPFPSPEAAAQAVAAFLAEVRVLRAKYRMPDVMLVVQVQVQADSDSATVERVAKYWGDIFESVPLAMALLHQSINNEREVTRGLLTEMEQAVAELSRED